MATVMAKRAFTRETFPANKEEADIAESEALAEFSNLSLDQRDTILFDIHGVAPKILEEPEFVTSKLAELEMHLSQLTKPALDKARGWSTSYVEDKSFRLWFLRCCRFDPKRAAEEFALHFEVKQELFGDGEILGRDVLLSDLTEEDMEALRTGFMQVLPSKDVAGRSVTCISTDWKENATVDSVGRAMWYYSMMAQKDEETQQRGTVFVIYNYGNFSHGPCFTASLRRVVAGLPLKIVGVHYCYKNISVKPFVAGIRRLFLNTDSFFHLVKHVGEPDEVAFELQTFGIKTMECPIQSNGLWDTECHLSWLQTQHAKEEELRRCAMTEQVLAPQEDERDESEDVILPGRFDVLFGRSTYTREHTGNVRLAHICEMFVNDYEGATKVEKTDVTRTLVGIIHESGGRFMRWKGDKGWVIVGDNVAREKIAHIFRNRRVRRLPRRRSGSAERKTPKRSSSC